MLTPNLEYLSHRWPTTKEWWQNQLLRGVVARYRGREEKTGKVYKYVAGHRIFPPGLIYFQSSRVLKTVLRNVEVSSYVQSVRPLKALDTSPSGGLVHSYANSVSPGSIQSRCKYCAETAPSLETHLSFILSGY